MRGIAGAFKALFIIIGALLCAAFVLVLRLSPVFAGGKGYELYGGRSSSSLIVQTDAPLLEKFRMGDVAGESARYEGDRYEELRGKFSAELLFFEEADGVVNYYLHSPLLEEGVMLQGKCVNLHIAVRENRTAAGTPLIFGGA